MREYAKTLTFFVRLRRLKKPAIRLLLAGALLRIVLRLKNLITMSRIPDAIRTLGSRRQAACRFNGSTSPSMPRKRPETGLETFQEADLSQ